MSKSVRNRFLFLLVATGAVMSVVALRSGGAATTNEAHTSWTQSRASQLVFFAVLEGLYRDGVTNGDVDLIVPPGKSGKPRFDNEHFVYACPLCHPAFEAFCVYRRREDFFGLKAPVDTFGRGLDQAVTASLRSNESGQRRQAIERLINRWVSQRLEMMRLTEAEREATTRELEKGRKQGMEGLKQAAQAGQASQTRTNCPICDGSFGACKR